MIIVKEIQGTPEERVMAEELKDGGVISSRTIAWEDMDDAMLETLFEADPGMVWHHRPTWVFFNHTDYEPD